jgi:hypothetical protein
MYCNSSSVDPPNLIMCVIINTVLLWRANKQGDREDAIKWNKDEKSTMEWNGVSHLVYSFLCCCYARQASLVK